MKSVLSGKGTGLRRRLSACFFLGIVIAVPAFGQSLHSGAAEPSSTEAMAAFIREAREATRKYHDLDEAIRAGYRLVGPDFPGMGDHWVNVRLAMRRGVDPAQPAVLSYLKIDGEAVLTGVAYAAPVLEGESPPDLPFPVAWHYHNGSIADETLHLNPHVAMHGGGVGSAHAGHDRDAPATQLTDHGSHSGTRLAMIHAWIWTENPAGTFAQQNWRLPLLRLRLDADSVSGDAGKALHLLAGGVAYYQTVIERAEPLSDRDASAVRAILESYRDRAAGALETRDHRVTQESLSRLESLWSALWKDLGEVSPDAKARLFAGS